jgi:uncharacterized membrane protein YbhN (UPF0104 family)
MRTTSRAAQQAEQTMPGRAGVSEEGATTISVEEARNHARSLRHGVVALVVLAILVGSLLLAVPGLHRVVTRLEHVSPAWLGLAIVLELLSGVGYVLVFQLVFRRVPRAFASRLAWAEMAFGAAVPVGGMGSIAIGAWVLCSRGMPRSRIVERSGVLFLLTSAVNSAVLAFFGLGLWLGVFSGPREPLLSLVPAGAAVGGLAFFLTLPRWARAAVSRRGVRGRILGLLRGLAEIVAATRKALLVRDWRLVGAFGYLLLDIAVLWVCFAAIGAVPPVASLVLAYQIGYLASLVPTPGGVGALDGGLIGMLVLYGANASSATAAVLSYHAIALWVPTLVGTLAFLHVRRQIGLPLGFERPAVRAAGDGR